MVLESNKENDFTALFEQSQTNELVLENYTLNDQLPGF